MSGKRFFQALIIILLVLGWMSSAAALTGAAAKVQPELAALAARDPGRMVHVIVQKTGTSEAAEARVSALGGKVTQELEIIHAFAAVLPARNAVALAALRSVGWISLDAEMQPSGCWQCIDTSALLNAYIPSIGADEAWNSRPYLQGNGVGVAVVDSGVNPNGDLYTDRGMNRLVANVHFNSDYNQTPYDGYGHGTVVSSIIAGDGSDSSGKYIGVAPMANIINVKVSNDDGSARMTDVVAGLQWILRHKNDYNIRVVNLSLNSSVAESYNTSPLDAAVEILWFNGIVVVVSAGNNGGAVLYPPANDPFVITVGAVDDKGTGSISDDTLASFTAYGTTETGAMKPDLVAPGRNIIGRLVNQNMGMAAAHPANRVGNQYFRLSGTSVAAPMVSGAVAILLQGEPNLTPDQVKFRLISTANTSWAGYVPDIAGAGYLDIQAAVSGTSTDSANTGTIPSVLLTTGSNPITFADVGWNSVGWNSVGWNSVGWNSVGWNSVGWNSDYWGQ